MKFLFSLLATVTGLFVIAWSVILAESFTEGVRVSPETLTLNPVNMFGNLSARRKDRF